MDAAAAALRQAAACDDRHVGCGSVGAVDAAISASADVAVVAAAA